MREGKEREMEVEPGRGRVARGVRVYEGTETIKTGAGWSNWPVLFGHVKDACQIKRADREGVGWRAC